jgi:translation initiation factor SUI1
MLEFTNELEKEIKTRIHIRTKQRTKDKYITTIEGLYDLDEKLSFPKILKHLKKTLHTNGTVNNEEKVILIFGDMREQIVKFLTDNELCTKEQIIVH